MVATEAQDNSVLNLSKGQTLLIKLPVQMGTGFSWVRVGKANLVRDDGNSVTSDKTVKPGGVETQVFQLTALAPGTETLRYLYVQPWNRGAKPAKSFQLKVLIASD